MNSSPESTMSGTISGLRTREALMPALAMLAVGPWVVCLVWMVVHAAGASLKPVVFLLGGAAPLIVIFLVVQLVRGRQPVMAEEPGPGLATHRGQFADRERVFGKDVPTFLIRNAKPTMPGILDEAEVAESGVTMNVETVLVAQFPGSKAARRAVTSYHRAFLLQNVTGDEARGWKARRSLQGDYVEMLCRDRVLFVWTGLSQEACSERRALNDIDSLLPAAARPDPSPLFPSLKAFIDWGRSRRVKALTVLLLLVANTGLFLKGALWAASGPTVPVVAPSSSQVLPERLMSISSMNLSFQVERGARPSELIVE